jgi:phosphoglucomutase
VLNKEFVHDYGKINAWNFYDLSESKEIRLYPDTVRHKGGVGTDCFLYLLFSDSSTEVEFVEITYQVGWVVFRLWGPVTDDQGRLYTQCYVPDDTLHNLLPIKEDRYAVVRRMHELCGGGEEFKAACKALRVSRLGLS